MFRPSPTGVDQALMKTCPDCGKEYPDGTTVCVTDGERLQGEGAIVLRKKIPGVWRGVYGYGERENRAGMVSVSFTLKLKAQNA